MKTFKDETIIISKEAWLFLQKYNRTSRGYPEHSAKWLERLWNDGFRNAGANPKTHPINDNEIRIYRDCFGISWDKIKTVLIDNGFSYRDDGYIIEGISI